MIRNKIYVIGLSIVLVLLALWFNMIVKLSQQYKRKNKKNYSANPLG